MEFVIRLTEDNVRLLVLGAQSLFFFLGFGGATACLYYVARRYSR